MKKVDRLSVVRVQNHSRIDQKSMRDLPVQGISIEDVREFVKSVRSRCLPVRVADLLSTQVLVPENLELAVKTLEPLADELRNLLCTIEREKGKDRSENRYRASYVMLLCNLIGIMGRCYRFDIYAHLFAEINEHLPNVRDPLVRIIAGNVAAGYLVRSGQIVKGLAVSTATLEQSRELNMPRAELMTLLNRVALLTFINDPDQAAEVAEETDLRMEALSLTTDDWLYAQYHMGCAVRHNVRRDTRDAIIACHEVIGSGPGTHPLLYLDGLSFLCSLYQRINHREEALEVALKGLRYAEELHANVLVARFWQTIASLYLSLNQETEAERAAEHALQRSLECGDQFLVISTRLLHGQTLIRLGMEDRALATLQGALELEASSTDQIRSAQIQKEIALIHRRKGAYEQAMKALERGSALISDRKPTETNDDITLERAGLYYDRGDAKMGTSALEELTTSACSRRVRTEAHRLLSEQYEKEEDLPRAFEHLKAYNRITLEREKDESEQRLTSARIMFDVAIHQEQARLDRLRREEAEEQLKETTLDLTERSALLQTVRGKVRETIGSAESESERARLQKIVAKIDEIAVVDKDQIRQIGSVPPTFFHELRTSFPSLTQGDLRLAGLLRSGLTSSDIASTLHISQESVRQKKYRLKKKMGLAREESLESAVQAL